VEPEPSAIPDDTAPETAEVESETTVEAEEEIASLPRPTAFAAALTNRPPRARPENFTDDIERSQFGGRTRQELSAIQPRNRPASAQSAARSERPEDQASELAVATSITPRGRPDDFDAIVAQAIVNARAAAVAARLDFETPDTRSAVAAALSEEELAEEEEAGTRPQDTPRLSIPSSASVSRQATIEDAIRLNQINLVGVYGVPSDRRALIRLSSGRYVKVKVGDRVDGGTVAQINDSELIYRKGSRTLSLSMPKG
jgi:type IV pilus biogenesis protein PilP